jgi:hypothetical protein
VKKVISTAQFKFFYHYYFDVGSTGVWIYLSYVPSPLWFSYFSDRVLQFFSNQHETLIVLPRASHIAGTTGVHHTLHLSIEVRISQTFCLVWLQIIMLPISAS